MKKQTKSRLRVPLQSLGIVMVMFFALAFSCREGKKSTTAYSPYKGPLNELLKTEMSTGLIKFKLVATRDVLSSYAGATEARGFSYTQEGGGVSINVDGALANYPSVTQANAHIVEMGKKYTLTKKSGGQRLSSADGKTVAWTNGSLLCVVTSGFAKPATNFETAAPF
jgi:hypothetical protein